MCTDSSNSKKNNNSKNSENSILMISAYFSFGFACLGLTVGWLFGSLVIAFDGVYSLVSVLLTALSIGVSILSARSSSTSLRKVLEPLVIAFKALVILMVVGFSLYSAVIALLNGGRAVDPSSATAFGVFSVLGCMLAWKYLVLKRKVRSTGLIDAEVKQWKMDALLSFAVAAGFIASWILSITAFSKYAVYADPLMMVLMSYYFIKVPLGMLVSACKSLNVIWNEQDSDIQAVNA